MSTDESAAAFAALLRRHRLAARLTQEDLAERAGLSARGISDLERGIKRSRSDTVALLVDALSLDPEARDSFVRASRRARLLPGEQVAPIRSEAPAELPAGGYLGAVPSFPLVARQAELAQVMAALDAAGHGGTRLLVLAGEPGVGKTRLAQEVMLQVRAAGWLTLVGRCYEEHQRTPYFPFRDILAAAWGAATPPLRERVHERFAALGRLLPEVLPPPPAEEDEEARLRLLRAVTSFLESLAECQPVLVLLDDLHWADQASIDVLRHLVRYANRVRLLGTYRDVEVGRRHPLEQVLAELARERLVDMLPLLPLSVEGTSALIAAQVGLNGVSSEQRAAIHVRAAGNPFFTTELVTMLVEQGALGREAETTARGVKLDLPLPPSVRSLVGHRARRLAPPAQEMLRLASVLGQEFELEALLAASEEDEDALLTHVDAALAARLLEERGVGRSERLAFTHALIAQVLYDEVPRFRRRRLHLRVAGALKRLRGGDGEAAELGRHYLAGGEPDQAVGYLERAGDEARAQQGRAVAEGFYREAVDWLDRLSRPLDAARVREKLGAVLNTGGQFAEAGEILELAAAAYRAAGDLEATGSVVAAIAGVYACRGAPGEGLARLEPTLEQLALGGASRALAALYIAKNGLLGVQGRFLEQLAAAEEGERICRLIGDDRQLAKVQFGRGVAFYELWRLDEAVRTLELAIPVAKAAGDDSFMAGALHFLAGLKEETGSFAESRQCMERALQLAEQRGTRAGVAWLTMSLGWLAYLSGDWKLARQRFEKTVVLYRELGPTDNGFLVYHNIGTLCMAEGADAAAAEHLQESERLWQAGQVAQAYLHFPVLRTLAERDLLAGHPEQARSRLAHVLDGLTPQAMERLPLLHLMAWALLEMDEVEAAAELATEAVTTARDVGARLLLVDTLRVEAMIAMRQRRWESAENALQEGLSLAQAMGYPYGEARLLQVAGELFSQMGQPKKARARLEEAVALAKRLGARRVAEQATYTIGMLR